MDFGEGLESVDLCVSHPFVDSFFLLMKGRWGERRGVMGFIPLEGYSYLLPFLLLRLSGFEAVAVPLYFPFLCQILSLSL